MQGRFHDGDNGFSARPNPVNLCRLHCGAPSDYALPPREQVNCCQVWNRSSESRRGRSFRCRRHPMKQRPTMRRMFECSLVSSIFSRHSIPFIGDFVSYLGEHMMNRHIKLLAVAGYLTPVGCAPSSHQSFRIKSRIFGWGWTRAGDGQSSSHFGHPSV